MNQAGDGADQDHPGGNGSAPAVSLDSFQAGFGSGLAASPDSVQTLSEYVPPDGGADVDVCIAELRAELPGVLPGSDEETDMMGSLAAALVERHEARACDGLSGGQGYLAGPDGQADLDGSADLDEAIGYLNLVIDRWPPGHASRADALFVAAAARYFRLFIHDDPADLDIAVANLTEVASGPLTGADDGEDLPLDVLALFGQALLLRYRAADGNSPDRAGDLSRAIRIHALVCAQFDEDEPVRTGWMADLGDLYYDRYRLTAAGEAPAAAAAGPAVGDLTRAIECYRWLRDRVRDQSAMAESSVHLGLFLAERVLLWSNGVAEVSEAISALSVARNLLPPDDDRLLLAGAYLGVMLGARFAMHGGAPVDRSDAIAVLGEVLASHGRSPGRGADEGRRAIDLAQVWLGRLLGP